MKVIIFGCHNPHLGELAAKEHIVKIEESIESLEEKFHTDKVIVLTSPDEELLRVAEKIIRRFPAVHLGCTKVLDCEGSATNPGFGRDLLKILSKVEKGYEACVLLTDMCLQHEVKWVLKKNVRTKNYMSLSLMCCGDTQKFEFPEDFK